MRINTDSMIKALGLTLVATALAACGPESGEPVDNATARDAITANTELISSRMLTSYLFLAESEMFSEVVDGATAGESECWGSTDTNGEFIEECSEPEPVDIDAELEAGTDALQAALEGYVFTESNVETSSGDELVYLLRGSTLCADLQESDAAEYSDCVSSVDDLQIRLAVTSPAAGDVSIDLLVGPDRHNPVSFDVWQDRLALEADLGGIKSTAIYAAGVMGEELPDIPETFEGRGRLELRSASADTFTVEASVLGAIAIANATEGYDVRVAKASPAATFTADAAAKTLTADIQWGAIDALFPAENSPSESEPGGPDIELEEEEATSHVYDLHLGGVTGKALFSVGQELLELEGVGLGADTTTLDVDGERVFGLDLNPADGRALDLTISERDDVVTLTVSPKLDLSLMFALGKARAAFSDLDDSQDWMLDDTIAILLSGATPALELSESGVKVVSGDLQISSTAASITHDASADQCLIEAESDVSTSCEPAPGEDGCVEP